MNNNTIVLTFHKERDTKATRRYQEETEEGTRGAVGTLYVLREALENAFGDPIPESLTVTIESNG